MKSLTKLLFLLILLSGGPAAFGSSPRLGSESKRLADREYTLQATMLRYFDENGVRNPVLKAQKGETVKITIVNGEPLTHDIALEKAGIVSETIIQTGETTSIEFVATESDIYFCSIPGHRLAGMEGRFEVVDGPIAEEETITGQLPQQDGKALH